MSQSTKIVEYHCNNRKCPTYRDTSFNEEEVKPYNGACPRCKEETLERREVIPPAPALPVKKIMIGVVTLLIVAGGSYLGIYLNSTPSIDVDVPITTSVSNSDPAKSRQVATIKGEPYTLESSDYSYEGESVGNNANGIGIITFKKDGVLISPNDHKKRVANKGQYLKGTFSNGKLVVGRLYDKDDNPLETLTIGKR